MKAEAERRRALKEHEAFVKRREDIQGSLLEWCIEALKPVDMVPARHHRLILRELEHIESEPNARLMLWLPPGSAKSTYASQLFPCHYLVKHPRDSIICASHTMQLAMKFGRRVRNYVVRHQNYLGYSIAPDYSAAGKWETSLGGEYYAAGVDTGIAGWRADLFVIDDPIANREQAESDNFRDKAWAWYKADVLSRMKPGCRIVVIQTRWHEDDLSGRLLNEHETGKQWRVLRLPLLADRADDPLGRKIGEPLWPEYMTEAYVKLRRAEVNDEREWGALYQQEPRPRGSSFFNVENCLLGGQPVAYPPFCEYVFATLDTAVKTGKHHDGTAIVFWAYDRYSPQAQAGNPLTVLDYDIVQIEGALLENWLPLQFKRLEELAQACHARFGSAGVWIEDKNSGSILLQQAARRDLPAHAIDIELTNKGKDERAISASGYVAAGKVKISKYAYDKTLDYKGRHGNHLLMQVFRFQLGVADQQDDLLDGFCYGISITLGDDEGR